MRPGALRVAVLESRRSVELCALIRRQGGTPISVPAVCETPAPIAPVIARLLDELAAGPDAVMIFSTAAGVEAVFAAAEQLGRRRELEALVARATTIARGPKPAAALRQAGGHVTVRVPDPATTTELIGSLGATDLRGRPAVLVHHGERNSAVVEALVRGGATVHEIVPYAWELPTDPGPLRRLVEEIIAGAVDAVAFTSQVQVRHLFRVATDLGRADALAAGLRHATVAAVGPTCAAALRAAGVPPDVVPENPRMGPLVRDLWRHSAQPLPGGAP